MRWLLPAWLTEGAVLALFLAGPVAAEARFDCVLRPSRMVSIGSPVTGVLSEVNIARGDQVTAGQRIARLEDRAEVAAVAAQRAVARDRSGLEAQQARLELAERSAERARELLARGSATQAQYDEAEAELEVNRAEIAQIEMELEQAGYELDRLQATLDLRSIESPFDGVVVTRALDAGAYVGQDAEIAQIAALDPLYVEAFLPITLYDQVSLGQEGQVELRQPAGTRAVARISVIDQVFDATSDTFGLRLTLSNPGGRIPAGQRCALTLEIDGGDETSSFIGLE